MALRVCLHPWVVIFFLIGGIFGAADMAILDGVTDLDAVMASFGLL